MKKRSLAISLAVVALFLVVGLFGLWMSNAVYIKRQDTPFIRKTASWLPAAKVGNRTITYGDFLASRDAIYVYMASQAASDAGLAGPVTPQVEKNALDRLVREAIEKEYAEQKGIRVTDEDVRVAFAELILSTSSTIPNVAQYLQDTFKWTEEDFREKVLRPSLLEGKVAESMSSSTDDQLTLLETYVSKRQSEKDVKIYLKF